jgi:hypothetical protein
MIISRGIWHIGVSCIKPRLPKNKQLRDLVFNGFLDSNEYFGNLATG